MGNGEAFSVGEARLGARLAAWGVHLLTASGAVLALLALLAVSAGDLRAAGLYMLAALTIDAVDGTLARRARVSEVLPGIDGRRLDDIVDYLNYVIVPAVFMVAAGSVLHWSVAAAPVLASAYGFSQSDAKTSDHFFVGFPSYWNALALYLWALPVGPIGGTLWVLGLSALVFLPIKYLYPSHMTTWFRTTNLGAALWVASMAALIAWPGLRESGPWLELTLIYPAYYVGMSLVLGGLKRSSA